MERCQVPSADGKEGCSEWGSSLLTRKTGYPIADVILQVSNTPLVCCPAVISAFPSRRAVFPTTPARFLPCTLAEQRH